MKKALLAALLAALMLVCTGAARFWSGITAWSSPTAPPTTKARTGPFSGQKAIRTW